MIVAMDSERGIGKDGGLPWHLPGDLRHFKELTGAKGAADKPNAVIMGRKTWESIPPQFRPLPNRLNVVLSRNSQLSLSPEAHLVASLEAAFLWLETPGTHTPPNKTFVIGGAQIFKMAMASHFCETLHVTHIKNSFACDTFFPLFDSLFEPSETSTQVRERNIHYFFAEYRRKKL